MWKLARAGRMTFFCIGLIVGIVLTSTVHIGIELGETAALMERKSSRTSRIRLSGDLREGSKNLTKEAQLQSMQPVVESMRQAKDELHARQRVDNSTASRGFSQQLPTAHRSTSAGQLAQQAGASTLSESGDITALHKEMIPASTGPEPDLRAVFEKRAVSSQELSTFVPAAPRKPTSTTPEDCNKNEPLALEPSFMMRPGLAPTPCDILVNVMTTFIDSADASKEVAQENVLRTFQRLRPLGVRGWLFTENRSWAQKAREHGVEVVARFRKNNANTPCLRYMYQYVQQNDGCGRGWKEGRPVFDGYVNGDILFSRDLVSTLQSVVERWGPEIKSGLRKGVLLVGIRYNKRIGSTVLDTEEELLEFGKDAVPFGRNAIDYFFFSRGGVDYAREMPGFVVGRPAYDNWLVNYGHHHAKLDVVDASSTIRAVHATAGDGNHAGHLPKGDRQHNFFVINPATGKKVGKHEWDHHDTSYAHFFSAAESGRVVFKARNHKSAPRRAPSVAPASAAA